MKFKRLDVQGLEFRVMLICSTCRLYEIIQLSIFVTNIENIFRQIPIIPHLRENTACGCWRKTKNVQFEIECFDIKLERKCHKLFIFWVIARTFFLWSYTVCFSKEIVHIILYFRRKIYFSIDYDDPMTSWHL